MKNQVNKEWEANVNLGDVQCPFGLYHVEDGGYTRCRYKEGHTCTHLTHFGTGRLKESKWKATINYCEQYTKLAEACKQSDGSSLEEIHKIIDRVEELKNL